MLPPLCDAEALEVGLHRAREPRFATELPIGVALLRPQSARSHNNGLRGRTWRAAVRGEDGLVATGEEPCSESASDEFGLVDDDE